MSAKVFINYRRDDSAPYAVSIAQYLENALGKDSVFIDVDWLRPGQSFPDMLNERLRDCEVMLVVIGPGWLDAADGATGRRLDNPSDWVRLEIVTALVQGLRIIPVLVGGARFPSIADLPNELRPLADRHRFSLTTDGFRYEMAGLAKDLAPLLSRKKSRGSNWSIMAISLRLSIVVGIVAGLWSYYGMYSRYHEALASWDRIYLGLRCASFYPDETLRQHTNQFGNIDISKVGCGDKTPYWASMKEIRGLPSSVIDFSNPKVDYQHYVFPSTAFGAGVLAMLSVNVLGLLVIGARWLAFWVIGIKRS